MLTHRPVADSRTAAGEPVVRDVDFGANLRRASWWWEAGPVDTCCCGCSLHLGVGLLATFDILTTLQFYWVTRITSEFTGVRETIVQMQDECSNGDRGVSSEPEFDCARLIQGVGLLAMFDILGLGFPALLIFGIMAARKVSEATIAQMQDEYTNNCGEMRPEPEVDCARLARNIERLQEIDPQIVVPVYVCLRGAFSLITVVVGFWAVFGSNATAAKLYLWTWAPRLLLVLVMAIVSVRSSLPFMLFWWGLSLLVLYFCKVVWSYHEVLKRRTLGSSPLGAAGDVELNASNSAGDAGSSGNLV